MRTRAGAGRITRGLPLLLLGGALAASCVPARGRCRSHVSGAPRPIAAPAPDVPPDPAYARMKLRRRYVRLVHVGAYADHFLVDLVCGETGYEEFEVTHDGAGRRVVRRVGEGFPGGGRAGWPSLP